MLNYLFYVVVIIIYKVKNGIVFFYIVKLFNKIISCYVLRIVDLNIFRIIFFFELIVIFEKWIVCVYFYDLKNLGEYF